MNKKYELINEIKEFNGVVLHRIKALKDFSDIKAGDLGGFIEKEENLSHNGDCWIYDNACVYGNAYVYGDAYICNNACVFGNARVFGNAYVYDYVRVFGDAHVYGDACVCDNARVNNDANIKSKFDACTFNGFGTEARTTTAYRCDNNLIKINCGCFNGTIDEFRNRIKETRKGKYAEEYLLIADVIERHFREE